MRDRGTPPPIAAADGSAVRDRARAVETSFRRSLRRATLVPIVLLTVGTVLVTVLVLFLRAAHGSVEHTDIVIARANLLQKLTVEREDALRGFLLSHERAFLDQFNAADLQLSPLFDELQDLMADDPDQVELLRSARVEVVRARHHAAQQLDRVMEGASTEAVARHVRDGTATTALILDRLAAFIAAEQKVRPRRVWRADQFTLYALILGAALGILAGGGIALATSNQMRLVRRRYVDLLERQERTERALADANARLREADRRKDDFLGLLSHELRNPLAPIRNSVHVLGRAEPGSDRALRARAVIERQVEHLTRLVEDLLDLKRISTGKLRIRPERIDLADRLRELVEDMRALFAQKGVRLDLLTPAEAVWIDADPTRIAEVVGNLLQNAVKFTDSGGAVTVVVDTQGRMAHVRVRDTGIGMAPELLGSLFDPFVQGPETLGRSMGGLGLGLALVRGIVELHGGAVSVASEPGRGTEFDVTLPLATAARAAERPRPTKAAAPARRRILVIEDNRDAAESLRDLLEITGSHEVSIARDGAEGLAAAEALRPDVILCDLGLPIVDGFEVARQLRAREGGRGVLLVALSGYAAPDDIDRSIRSGFDYHLPKPPELEALLGIIANGRERSGSSSLPQEPPPEPNGGQPNGRPA